MGFSYKQDYGYNWQDAMGGLNKTGYGGAGGGGSYGAGAGLGAAGVGAGIIGGAILGGNAGLNSSNAGASAGTIAGAIAGGLQGGNPGNVTKPPIIEDKTHENTGVESVYSLFNPFEEARKYRDEEWAREDAIRAETQAREDTAYSRAIKDLQRSGVNVNLLGSISPAASGGGITNQTGSIDYTMTAADYNKTMELVIQEIENNFKGDQAEKDRFAALLNKLILGGAILTK